MLKVLNFIIVLIWLLASYGCSHLRGSQGGDCSRTTETGKIAAQIKSVQPQLSKMHRERVACYIDEVSRIHRISPKIFVAIIDTESNFRQEMVSSTGDISIAQINTEVWNREFSRMKKRKIDKTRLSEDPQYAVKVMGEILEILKQRYGYTDRAWFARYHSASEKYKTDYLLKLEQRIQKMNEQES